MSMYTTGEIARLCGVTVRTVQYYDTRNILTPSELSEGGRRLYSEQDLRRMKIICFLRDAGVSINTIGDLLSQDNPGDVISVVIGEQEKILSEEMDEIRRKKELIDGIKRELRKTESFTVDSIIDIAYSMENRKKLKQLHIALVLAGIPVSLLQWTAIILWIATGIWWPFVFWCLACIPFAVWISIFYFRRVEYICPNCHEIFRPQIKESIFAAHTPTLRKLTCCRCGYKGFCVETYGKEEKSNGKSE